MINVIYISHLRLVCTHIIISKTKLILFIHLHYSSSNINITKMLNIILILSLIISCLIFVITANVKRIIIMLLLQD